MTAAGRAARIPAQAKLNLALRVLGRDGSGYHNIETLFIRLDLADTLLIRSSDRHRSVTSDVSLGPPEKNLAQVAALKYSAAAGWPDGWEIQIEKRIPMGAGLGGGSADAGAVLRGLNKLSPKPLPREQLQEIGTSIGADVGFMASESVFAFAEGFGEKLTECPAPPPRTIALAIPSFAVSTREAYSWIDTDRAMRSDRARWDLAGLTWPALERLVANDFTPVVAGRHPEIRKLKDWFLAQGAVAAEMTGSGSVVFGIFDDKPPSGGFLLPVEGKLLWTSSSSRVVEPELMG